MRDVPHLAELWSYINPFMLYDKNMGYKGNFEKELAGHDPKALPWLDPPAPAALEAAELLLRRLGAIEPGGAATQLGRRCARPLSLLMPGGAEI